MDKIKSQLTTAYMMFVFEFADPSQVTITPTCKIQDLFNSQKTADTAKRILGKNDFKKVLSLYFNQYQNTNGVDFDSLEASLQRNKKVLLRHLGKDKMSLLSLIVVLSKDMAPAAPVKTRRGLLFEGQAS